MTYSYKQYYERMRAGAGNAMLREDQPMDAGYTWTLLDNIAHLVDESPKYRINWINANPSLPGLPGNKIFYFFTQITENNRYPRFDVRAAFGLGNSEVPVRVSLCTPWSSTVVRSSSESGVLGTWTGTSPDYPDAAWTIDARTGDVDTNQCPIYSTRGIQYLADQVQIGYMVPLRVIVEYDYQTGESGFNTILCGLQVREFLVP